MRGARWGVLAALAVLAWGGLALLLRVDLPGAAWVPHLALRAVMVPLEWLTEDRTHRLKVLGAAWVALGLVGLRWTPARRAWSVATAAALGVALAVVGVVGVLMERGAAVGVLAGALAGGTTLRARMPRAARWLAAPAGAAALAYLYSMLVTDPVGYGLVHGLGHNVRAGVVVPERWLLGGLVLALPLLVLALPRRPALQAVGAAAVAGLAAGALLDVSPVTLLTPLLAAVGALLLAIAPGRDDLGVLLRWLGGSYSAGPSPSATAVLALVGPALVGALLMAGTYAGRVYDCPPPTPGLTRVVDVDEVFRAVPGPDDAVVALALRRQGRIGRWWPDTGHVDLGGPLLGGAPEELVWAPGRGFFASVVTEEPPDATDADGAWATNRLVRLDEDAAAITHSEWVQVPCWVNTMAWHPRDDRLVIGCEDRPGMYWLDGDSLAPVASITESALGDVQALAFDDAGAAYTISLWRTPAATAVDEATATIARQRLAGGSQVDLGFDPVARRLFATSWYGARVRVLDADDLRTVASLPTGFGARAVAVDAARRLLLVSSVYGGQVQVFDLDSLERVAALPVGGHVKDIAVLDRQGLAVFWSQCGLYSWELPAR